MNSSNPSPSPSIQNDPTGIPQTNPTPNNSHPGTPKTVTPEPNNMVTLHAPPPTAPPDPSPKGKPHYPSDEDEPLTFFTAMLHSFSDIILLEDGGIEIVPFLLACEGIIPFLDTIGSTAFAPVRIDFMGNIKKLRTKQESDTKRFHTLQDILHQEIVSSTSKVRNSATDALMWLKRGLRFIQKFLVIFKNGERDLTVALNKAYARTLKPYHSWVVKGIFALAVKAAPYSKHFIQALANIPD
uniref:Glycolipid transfer protein domain-containing protein n=1 Tax=Ciona savignyi TaxID=51511 RepID=H2Y740_CIOSA